MCDVWKAPTRPADEIGPDVLEKLPDLFFANVTGGEPFIRKDLCEIIALLRRKARRVVISTNGYFTDRIIALCEQFGDVGVRISIEGLPKTNDEIRGIPDGFDRALRTLLTLREMGMKDIGFAMTLQDANCRDLVGLYGLARSLGCEFATAAVHNSHYFNKWDNAIDDKGLVCGQVEKLIDRLLRTGRAKNWFRAYFNLGLINYIRGNARPLPCRMGSDGVFIDPWGDVLACNGMDRKMPMGNLRDQSWSEIWDSPAAEQVRRHVAECSKQCWMIGNAAPAMWRQLRVPMKWALRNRLRVLLGKGADVSLPGGPCQ